MTMGRNPYPHAAQQISGPAAGEAGARLLVAKDAGWLSALSAPAYEAVTNNLPSVPALPRLAEIAPPPTRSIRRRTYRVVRPGQAQRNGSVLSANDVDGNLISGV
jgi:hypothetical protein